MCCKNQYLFVIFFHLLLLILENSFSITLMYQYARFLQPKLYAKLVAMF